MIADDIAISQKIITDIHTERRRQNRKWGVQRHNPVEWMAILTEEVGEASKEAVDLHFMNKGKDPNISGQDLRNQRIDDLRKEMVQVAAVAFQIIENIDRDQDLTPLALYKKTYINV